MNDLTVQNYLTAGGVQVRREARELPCAEAVEPLIEALDGRRGALFSSSYEFPGRYRRWDLGFVDPPLQFIARGRSLAIEALNRRGEVLLGPLREALLRCEAVASLEFRDGALHVAVKPAQAVLFEEQRSRRHSVFSVLRAVIALFRSPEDAHLGLYGAFGYELAFQFEPVRPRLPREGNARDLVLFLPDELTVVDHRLERAFLYRYDFTAGGASTAELPRDGESLAFRPPAAAPVTCDHRPGEYAVTVRKALDCFRRGDLFEAVPGQLFSTPCRDSPGAVFRRLRRRNPAPYGAFLNLGEAEYLVAASPEMFVRVEGERVESCPISGTIARGADAMEDAVQIRRLLNSEKDLAELSMCTDVDRNDKARICLPGSVRVIGRRQVELYSRLIHTVDHVEGRLKPGYDALDAFLTHTWAVTVTGAPKQAAIQFIEDHEKSPRRWYGGAMGRLCFNGDMNTGLTLRTVRIADGIAEVRAGATLLADSDPEAEEAETRLKASALLDAIVNTDEENRPSVVGASPAREPTGGSRAGPAPTGGGRSEPCRVLMVDFRDSFVHTLSSYFQAGGAEVATVRHERFAGALFELRPRLVVLSPGPGRPADFGMSSVIALALQQGLPLFGVCLGLQGIVEYFGGRLGRLDYPVHGKASRIRGRGALFEGLPEELTVGRYHSLVAEQVPAELEICARTEEGVVMAVQHRELPLSAVQFHPESILSLEGGAGMRLVENVLSAIKDENLPLAAEA